MKRRIFVHFISALIVFCLFNSTLITFAQKKPKPKPRQTSEKTVRRDDTVSVNNPNTAQQVAPKFALLVGINRYDAPIDKLKPLEGAENDVDEMRKLLTELYDFPNDDAHIVELKSEKATKLAIITAFESHLIKNAEKFKSQKPTIVFYFSGHGSRIKDTTSETSNKWLKANDEGDGIDETLVPHDRLRKDANDNQIGDIIDDELEVLFEKLRVSTGNITVILDSCHSGTGTRDVEGLNEREAPSLDINLAKDDSQSAAKDRANGIMPPSKNNDYVTISGCLPYQKSYENEFKHENGEVKMRGIMTYYLIQALRNNQKNNENLTYGELGDIIRKQVEAKLSYQSPQVEGNLDRAIFFDADPNARRYIKIGTNPVDAPNNTITIKAGKVQGIKEGTFVAVYPRRISQAQNEPLGFAEVKTVTDFNSTAELQKGAKPIAAEDRVVILTPGFGSSRLPVVLDTNAQNKTVGAKVITDVERLLKNYPYAAKDAKDKSNPLVKVVATAARPLDNRVNAEWSTAVVRETFLRYKEDLTKKLPPSKGEDEVPGDKDEVFYIMSRDGIPLYDFYVRADEPEAVARIVEALEKRAQQANVSTISNSKSVMTDKIKLTLLKVELDPSTRSEKTVAELPANKAVESLTLDERFRFQIENKSDRPIFLTLIAINPSGSISIVSSPEDFGGEIKPSTDSRPIKVKSARLKTSPPTGMQGFKLIITTKQLDFSFLEQPGLTRNGRDKEVGALLNPFAKLVGQAFLGGTRDVGKDNDVGFDDWTTVDVNLVVKEKARP